MLSHQPRKAVVEEEVESVLSSAIISKDLRKKIRKSKIQECRDPEQGIRKLIRRSGKRGKMEVQRFDLALSTKVAKSAIELQLKEVTAICTYVFNPTKGFNVRSSKLNYILKVYYPMLKYTNWKKVRKRNSSRQFLLIFVGV